MAKAVMRKPKKKVCQFCKEKATGVDYKDTALLRKFISDRGKIRARRVTGNCVQHQRDVAIAVKNAREVALLPYTSTGSLRGARDDEAHPDPGGHRPRRPRRRRRGQGRLRPQLPRPARLRDPLDPGRREDSRVDQGGARRRARCATTTTPSEIKAKLEAPAGQRPGPRRRRAAGSSARSPPPTSPPRSPRPPASRSTSARSWSATRSSRSAPTQVAVKLHDEVSASVAPQRRPGLTDRTGSTHDAVTPRGGRSVLSGRGGRAVPASAPRAVPAHRRRRVAEEQPETQPG